VTKKGDILVCNCKGFRYKRNCSHIRQVIEKDEDKLDVELVKKKKFNDVLDRIGIKVANHLIKELGLKAEGKKVDFRSNEQLKIITEEYPDFEYPNNKKQAIDLLLDTLQNEKLRGRAAHSLGKIGEKRAVEPLLTYIWKGDLDTVLEIIDALGAIGASHAFEPLEKLLRTSHSYTDSSRRLNVRIRAANALASFGSRGIFTLASELENEYHGEAIDEFILALAKACESSTDEYEKKDAAEAILTVVRKTDPNVRYHFDDRLRLAAQALGNIGHQVALEPLREKLKEAEAAGPNPGYRSVTIQVRPTPSDGAPEWLVESIKEAIKTIGAAKKALDKPKVKKAAAKARRDKKVLADMLAALPPKLRKAAEKEMAEARKQPQKIAIAPMRLSKRNETRDAHLEPIIKELGDSEHLTRAAAARTLGKIGDARAIEALTKALGDENKYVRKYAKEALEKLGHEVE
jgi:HEAT repeat protein